MNKKLLIETLKQNMPQGLSEIEIARYVYIELAKMKSFDIRYYYGNSKTRSKIYKLAQKTEHNTEPVADKRTIICVSLSYLYRDVLRELGINCDTLLYEDDPDRHICPIVKLSDGRFLEADVQLDLHKIQTRSKTKHFKIASFSKNASEQISEEELKNIDKKIGYIQSDYKDEDLDQVRKEIEGMDAITMLENVLSNPQIYQNPDLVGYVEVQKYYYSVLKNLISKFWKNKTYLLDCYKENEDGSKQYVLCAFAEEKEKVGIHMYSSKEGRFVPVTIEEMINFQNEGLILGRYKGQNGLNLLKKHIRRAQTKGLDAQEKNAEGTER